jgi:hypothetical protein
MVCLKVLNFPTKASKIRPYREKKTWLRHSSKKDKHPQNKLVQGNLAYNHIVTHTNRIRASSIDGWSTPFSNIGST